MTNLRSVRLKGMSTNMPMCSRQLEGIQKDPLPKNQAPPGQDSEPENGHVPVVDQGLATTAAENLKEVSFIFQNREPLPC
jgi:hypothetical protein